MLGKLMKYEMSAMGRILLPLYVALLFMSLVMGIVVNILDVWAIFKGIVILLYSAVAIGAAIMTAILIVRRFYKNLLGNEGYLTFALPVTTGRHIWNKGITAIIWMTIGSIVGILSALIIIASTGELRLLEIGTMFSRVWELVGAKVLLYSVELLVVFFLSMAHTILQIYAAISLGHLWSNYRILGAILAYLGLSVAETIIFSSLGRIGIGIGLMGDTSKLIVALGDEGPFHLILLVLGVYSAIISVAYYVITHYILKNKLNLE